MSYITVSSLPALLSTSLPTRSPSPPRRVQKGHVDVTAPRPRARFSPLWLPLFSSPLATPALIAIRETGLFVQDSAASLKLSRRTGVGGVECQYGLEHRSLTHLSSGLHHWPNPPLKGFHFGNKSAALTDKPADAVPRPSPTGITRGMFVDLLKEPQKLSYVFVVMLDLPWLSSPSTRLSTLDWKLAASASTSDWPRFRPPLDKSTVFTDLLATSTESFGSVPVNNSLASRRLPVIHETAGKLMALRVWLYRHLVLLGADLYFRFHRKDVASRPLVQFFY
ncbi:hypothetical protein BDZ89DRAFT_1134741 [Hymenopellis radicata]|nr:hypothetical protein BDZ89DRAFT_1134741 [Hymenopellis radicata]